MPDDLKCPKCGHALEQGRSTETQDGRLILSFSCPRCGYEERRPAEEKQP